MAPPSIADSDPFKDPIAPLEENDLGGGSTLVVGRDASLTLATDSLIVLGKMPHTLSPRPQELTLEQTRTCVGGLSIAVVYFPPVAT